MRVLTPEQAETFKIQHGWTDAFDHLAPETSRTQFSTDVGQRCVWANALTNHLIATPDCIAALEISDWAVWPSSQNMDLIYSYRELLGEKRPLIEANFHVFKAHEACQLRNILHISLISLFDVAGASTGTDFSFYASHDEYLEVLWYPEADWVETLSWMFVDDDADTRLAADGTQIHIRSQTKS
ncbi:MAG: hypothetical protein JSS87_09645 [Acidobacteria bacterium]|nr:hypothetical protein [Acidobacteriota bacterium]